MLDIDDDPLGSSRAPIQNASSGPPVQMFAATIQLAAISASCRARRVADSSVAKGSCAAPVIVARYRTDRRSVDECLERDDHEAEGAVEAGADEGPQGARH